MAYLDTERRMQIRNTRAFIQGDPVDLTFSRPTTVVTSAGGHRPGTPVTLPPQQARLVPLSGNVWDRSKEKTDEGNMPDTTFQLVGMPTLNVKKGDRFVYEDKEWLVHHVSPERTTRTSANIRLITQDAP